MEAIGWLLLVAIVNLVAAALKNAGKRAGTQPPRRAPGHSPRPAGSAPPRRRLEDIVGQMMEAAGLEDGGDAPAEGRFEAEGGYAGEDSPADGFFGEGESRRDVLGCVGGTLAHDAHEGEEFPGHVHANPAPLAVSEPVAAPASEPAGIRARLAGGQARYAMVAAEVLGRPVSMRRKGGYRF